jgi:hypothetical protein
MAIGVDIANPDITESTLQLYKIIGLEIIHNSWLFFVFVS